MPKQSARKRGEKQEKSVRRSSRQPIPRFDHLAESLAEIGRDFHRRGWLLGTSGNLSAVASSRPVRLAITATGLDKGALEASHFLEIDEAAQVLRGKGRPSAETGLHLAVVRVRGAGAVLHTHSVWSTILSESLAPKGGVHLEGFEMLKGLDGVATHDHREWLPILDNRQDIPQLAATVEELLGRDPAIHGFLLRRHGLYTWGKNLAEAKRHVEILEFLLEVLGRTRAGAGA